MLFYIDFYFELKKEGGGIDRLSASIFFVDPKVGSARVHCRMRGWKGIDQNFNSRVVSWCAGQMGRTSNRAHRGFASGPSPMQTIPATSSSCASTTKFLLRSVKHYSVYGPWSLQKLPWKSEWAWTSSKLAAYRRLEFLPSQFSHSHGGDDFPLYHHSHPYEIDPPTVHVYGVRKRFSLVRSKIKSIDY